MSWRRFAAPIVLAAATLTAACSDGTPAFCTPLADVADLDGLADAIERGDLDVATNEAQRLVDLAEDAPAEIRADLTAIGAAVVDLVELVGEEQRAADLTAGDLTRRREQLNAELSRMDERSDRVIRWARRECGLDLTRPTD